MNELYDVIMNNIVILGFTTRTTDPEQTTIPAILQTSTYYIPALPTPTPSK